MSDQGAAARLREIEAERERLIEEVRAEQRAKTLGWGDRVRVSCTATGLYLGKFCDVELALFVSAMDNSVNVDRVDREREPNPDRPVPTGRELEAATNGLRYGIDLQRGQG